VVTRSLPNPAPDISDLLAAWSGGDQAALDELTPLVYRELRKIARRHLRRERPGHTLQSSDLVNEVYLRLAAQTDAQWQHRSHFFAVAAGLMRRILVDHARRRTYRKRGGSAVRVPLDEAAPVSATHDEQLAALDEALTELQRRDKRKCQVVELRYFGGLNVDEISEVLGVSPVTVKRDWAMAKAWLHRHMKHSRE